MNLAGGDMQEENYKKKGVNVLNFGILKDSEAFAVLDYSMRNYDCSTILDYRTQWEVF